MLDLPLIIMFTIILKLDLAKSKIQMIFFFSKYDFREA